MMYSQIAKDTASILSFAPRTSTTISGKALSPPISDYEKSITEVFKDFVEYCVNSSGSLVIIYRHWAPVIKKQQMSIREKIKSMPPPTREQLPSWIPSVSRSPFGTPEDALNGRKNGDSFVSSPDHRNYSATPGTRAVVSFKETADENIYRFSTSTNNTPADRTIVTIDCSQPNINENSSDGSTPRVASGLPSPTSQNFHNDITFKRVSSPLPLSPPTLQLPASTHLYQASQTQPPAPISPINLNNTPDQLNGNGTTWNRLSDGKKLAAHGARSVSRSFSSKLPRPASGSQNGHQPQHNNLEEKTASPKPPSQKKMRSDGSMSVKDFRLDIISELSSRTSPKTSSRKRYSR
jgi:hypothetical protein